MLSPTANLFVSLRTVLSSLSDSHGNKYFSYIDQDLGQLDQPTPSVRPAVTYPCVLIDIAEIRFSSVAENVQSGKCTLNLKLVFPPFSSAASTVPDTYMQKAIYYYDLEQMIYLALQGKPPVLLDDGGADILKDIFGNFNRVSSATLKRKDALRVRILCFEISYDDYSDKGGYALHPAVLNLTDELNL